MKTVLMALVSVLIYGVAIFSGISAQAPALAEQGALIKVQDDGDKKVKKAKKAAKKAKKAVKKAKKDED